MTPITLEQFFKHLKSAACLVDNTGKIILSNSTFDEYFARKKDADTTWEECFLYEPKLTEYLKQVRETIGSYYLRDLALPVHEGPARKMDVEMLSITNDAGALDCIAVFFHEHFSQNPFGEHQKRLDKFNYLATLSAGLAHEIRNPLSGIRGASQLLSTSLKDQGELGEYAEIIQKEVSRVDSLLKELLHLVKPKKLNKTRVNLNQILHDIIVLQRTVSPEKVQMIEQYDPSLPPILADGEALSQIFLNLIKNARESIPKKGTVTIRSRIVLDYALKKLDRKHQVIGIEIEDTGEGIEEAKLANIFVPFFTTRAKGTGLGLALCHQLVEEHEGDIRVKTEKGKGTLFTVYLPME